MKVRVHYNLTRGDFSVVDPKTGRVVTNVDVLIVKDAEFRVSEKARQKVIASNRRTVHAYVAGTAYPGDAATAATLTTAVTYNPYRAGWFHPVGEPGKPILKADVVMFRGRHCWIKL